MPNITIGYTIHNKVELIPQIEQGLKKSFTEDDEFYFLFDNCTDGSFQKLSVDDQSCGKTITTFSNEDLFEIKANNTILKRFMENSKNDTIILFQDDIVCNDPLIKEKIFNIQEKIGDELGLMGGRTGFELISTQFPEVPVNKVSNWEHKPEQYGDGIANGGYAVRTFLNRGPIVFTKKLIEKVGYLNEDYYPQWGDDLDYCARCKFEHGLRNVVFQCNVESKLEWGTMRKKPNPIIKRAVKPNWRRFIAKWGKYIV